MRGKNRGGNESTVYQFHFGREKKNQGGGKKLMNGGGVGLMIFTG